MPTAEERRFMAAAEERRFHLRVGPSQYLPTRLLTTCGGDGGGPWFNELMQLLHGQLPHSLPAALAQGGAVSAPEIIRTATLEVTLTFVRSPGQNWLLSHSNALAAVPVELLVRAEPLPAGRDGTLLSAFAAEAQMTR